MSGILSKRGIVERICLTIYPYINSKTITLECYQLKQSCSKMCMSNSGNKGGGVLILGFPLITLGYRAISN